MRGNHDTPDPFDADAVARITETLIEAIGEATIRTERGDYGADVRDLVQHCGEMLVLLAEQVCVAPESAAALRGKAEALGVRVAALEQLLADKPESPASLH